MKRIAFAPDRHFPNHHTKLWNLWLRALKAWKPHILVSLGDAADFESVSLHEPDDIRQRLLKQEAQEVRACLAAEVAACGKQLERKVYIEGNHEQRLDRYVARKAPALWGTLNTKSLLRLEESGWEFVPYRKTFKLGKLHITHDTGKAGRNAHAQSAQAHLGSTVIGHTHRMAYEVRGRFDGLPYLAAMFGWLGDPDTAASYTHEANACEWAHGFGVGVLLPSGIAHVQPVPIVDGACWVAGQMVT